jgi:hypothetical protein
MKECKTPPAHIREYLADVIRPGSRVAVAGADRDNSLKEWVAGLADVLVADSRNVQHMPGSNQLDAVIDTVGDCTGAVRSRFEHLFPLLRDRGLYLVEGLHSVGDPRSMAFFAGLTDGLNHVEFPIRDYRPTYFDRNITEVAFFYDLIILRKGANSEDSNASVLVQREIALTSLGYRRR